MILVDTNALVGLADATDPLHRIATADLLLLNGQKLITPTAVLAEAYHLLRSPSQREKLHALMELLSIRPCSVEDEYTLWVEVFGWLARYAEHEPDWTDAYLAVLSGRDRRFKVWTYDQEFTTIWRRPDGSRIPLAARRPR
jgi:predicted nucleic acid-binding protein